MTTPEFNGSYLFESLIRKKKSNRVILEGNLVRDPEANLTPKGTPVCKFSVAGNRYYKSEGVRQEELSYFDVEVWSKVAESCEKHLKKGRGVRVVSRLKQDRWTDDQGSSHYRVKVVGEHVEFKPEHRADSRNPTQADEAEAKETEEMMDTLKEEVGD